MDGLARRWSAFWFAPAPLVRLAAFRILLVIVTFWDFWSYSFPIYRFAPAPDAQRSWRPLYALEVLGIGPIDVTTANWIFAIFCVAIACALVGLMTRTACFVVAVLVLYWTAQVYSFGKAHHDKVAFAFAWMTLPFSPCGARLSLDAFLARMRRVRRGGDPFFVPVSSAFARTPLRMTQVSIATGYFFAGASKLVIIGPGWANGWTLQGIMASFDGYFTELLLPDVTICRFLSILTLVCQLCFPVVFFVRRLRWFFLPVAAGFHIVAWMTMETGPYMSLWFLLIAFLPLERVPAWLASNLRSGLSRAVPTLALTLPFVAVFFIQWFAPYTPRWLICVFIPPLLAFALLLLRPRRLTLAYDSDRDRATVAKLAALDWSNQLHFVETTGATLDSRSEARLDLEGLRSAAVRLPLVIPIAWILWLPFVSRAMSPRSETSDR